MSRSTATKVPETVLMFRNNPKNPIHTEGLQEEAPVFSVSSKAKFR